MQLSLYSDGSSHAKGGLPGGWAWVLVNAAGPVKAASGGHPATSNNRMELHGIKSGLYWVQYAMPSLFPDLTVLDVVSDSQYALGVSSGRMQPSKNKDIVDDIWATAQLLKQRGVEIRWTWVRGHDGNTWNERVDRMAVAAKERVIEVSRRQGVVPASTS